MRKQGHFELGVKILRYNKLPTEKRERLRQQRLVKLLNHAKENSPFYAELYKDIEIGEDTPLSSLPSVTKATLMSRFNDWCTDREINYDGATAFIANLENFEKKYLDKYVVTNTSGSTGVPALIIQDESQITLSATVSALRLFKFKFPIANVADDDGYGADNVSIHHYNSKGGFMDRISRVVDATRRGEAIINELNEYKPRTVFGYPSTFLMLTEPDVIENNKITIKPDHIFTGGEFLTETVRDRISDAFNGAPVSSVYGCTEGGPVAFECSAHHMHLNDDWYIIEPVNHDGGPTKEGELSDKAFLTVLNSYVQPIIRYEMTDRIYVGSGDCPCGKKGFWFKPEGRSNDLLRFNVDGKIITVSPMSLITPLEDAPGMKYYQLVLHNGVRLEMRISTIDGFDKNDVFAAATENMTKYLENFGVKDVEIYLSEKPPQRNEKTGKLKQAINVED